MGVPVKQGTLPVRTYRILNLGAGVQSTTLYLMFRAGLIVPQIDVAIFADTQEEPAAVYAHLAWLRSLDGPPIWVRTAGKLGDDLQHGRTGRARFASQGVDRRFTFIAIRRRPRANTRPERLGQPLK